ncbi:hypothetical protein [Maioricimonas sp. JC845]|uniref:hypothetical protein n=1 Tax=Maioricimonas sp. JC845 TaxID=3232138 RepID=UPI0034576262
MPTSQITPGILLFLLTATLWWDAPLADAQTLDANAGPQAVVARWLELHRAGNRDEASALTTGTQDHRANVLLSSRRAADVHVERSLGNERAAAVATNALDDSRDGERVLLFWLARRDGAWRINKSDLFERKVVDERLRGFLEAEDVRWHVPRDQLAGRWESGPCRPPGVGGIIACGSRLQLDDNNRFRLAAWGPGGPHPDYDSVVQGKWRVADGELLLSHQDQLSICRVAWIADDLLVLERLDERGEVKDRARYEREEAIQARRDAAEREVDQILNRQ